MPTLCGLSLGEVYFDLESTNGLEEYIYPLDVDPTSLSLDGAVEKSETGRYYPYFGLFLDPSHCLVLKPVHTNMSFQRYDPNAQPGEFETLPTYERVGTGNFLRTEYQVRTTPDNATGTVPVDDSFGFTEGFKYGPIDETYARIAVMIL